MNYESLTEMRAALEDAVGDIDPDSLKGKKRLRIVEAAIALFVAHGYRKTSIDDIARAAGIAKGTVYLYFATKVEVLMIACAYEKLRLFALLDGIDAPTLGPRDRLRQWVRASILMVAASPLLSRAAIGDPDILAALIEGMPERTAQAMADAGDVIGGLLDAAVAPQQWTDDERRARIAVVEALTRFAPLLRDDPLRQGLSIERFADALADVVVDGMHIPPRDRTRA
ncbi:TetR/AcrR family transcriptional regulator [Nannocystis sp. SCPEA4]|uniref:TetR/AcrR family transcriptional regulator n=1 Tax=Nannocystis sp. SCPEA4 TaxID=2996787 RepID=UPI00226E8F19|nr:TetR/AcrR family transcriptional regulator [Nannocystis sp. SCPEA4]MCY1058815.1 helix-turn-helix domain containing protein [Nannocystis sp. SCPEA4]